MAAAAFALLGFYFLKGDVSVLDIDISLLFQERAFCGPKWLWLVLDSWRAFECDLSEEAARRCL